MSLTPERLAFIQGGVSNPTSTAEKPQTTQPRKTVEVKSDNSGEVPIPPSNTSPTNSKPTRRSSRSRAASPGAPQPEEILSQLWMPITTRLQHRTGSALRRATLEQRLRHAKPDTQQEIIDLAVQDWLMDNGFLD